MAIRSSIDHLLGYGVQKSPSYVFGKSIEEAQEEWGSGELLRMGSNENAYGTSPKAAEAIQALLGELNRYPDPVGLRLKRLLAAQFGLTVENFALSNGSANLMAIIGREFITEGDEVIFETPSFSEYKTQTLFNRGVPVSVELAEDDYALDLDKMYSVITDKTKMIWICNPNNPTGMAVEGDALEAFIRKVPDDVVIVIDEAYIEFADAPKYRSMVGLIEEKNLIILRTFSKIYGLGAMRLGYAVARREIADCLNAHITSFPVSSLTLAAACAAVEDREFIKMCHDGIKQGREYLTAEFESLGWKVYPSQTNFMFVDSRTMSSVELTDALYAKGIIIRGNFRFPRITIGTPEENKRLAQACREIAAGK